jgi:hypothetical protein
MFRLSVCAAIGVTGLLALSANAALLSDLVGKSYNPQDESTFIKVGDKIFTDFGYAFTGDMPSAGAINVIPQIQQLGDPFNQTAWGIRFQGAFQDLPGGGASDALITYTVIVDSETLAISDAHIAANFLIPTTGNATITETWLPDNASAVIKVYNLNNQAVQLVDGVSFLPTTYKVIHAQKDILLDAGALTFPTDEITPSIAVDGPGLVQMSFVDQLYTQTPGGGETPEPASLSLLAIGGTALLLRRKRA